MSEKQQKEYDEIAQLLMIAGRQNFWAFCCYYDYEFFRIKRHFLKEVALLFQSVFEEYKKGNALRVSISLPPRAGKSYITSLFAAWWLGRLPELSVMRSSCTGTLYDKFSYDTRAIVLSQKYRNVFPEIKLKQDRKNLDGWSLETAKQVSYFGAGVGGNIIGFGANLALSDDLYTGMKSALSTTIQQTTKLWKKAEFDSRKERNCPEIMIGTRWTKDDIIGEAIEEGIDSVIKISALNNEGESFCEDVKSTDEYKKIRESHKSGKGDGAVWLAEYMQQPADMAGTLLPINELRFDDLSRLSPDTSVFRFAIGDPADQGGDKYACPFCYVIATSNTLAVYVKYALCNTDGIMANTPRIEDLCRRLRIDLILIENNGVGVASYIEVAKALKGKLTQVVPFTSSINKDVRILSNFEFIKKYFVFDSNYVSDPEYNRFMLDLTSFNKEGDNKHKKDAIDVLSTAAEAIKSRFAQYLY